MKKILTLIIIFALAPSVYAQREFSDINDHEYREAIINLQDQGLVGGYANNNFKPDAPITRAEFLKIIISATHSPYEARNCTIARSFTDTSSRDWVAPYICLALRRDIISGYSDGTFRPNSYVSFAEALKISLEASRAFTVPEENISQPWFDQYISYATDNGLPLATSKPPTEKITRGEMAGLIFWLQQAESIKQACNVDAQCKSDEICLLNHCQKTNSCDTSSDCPAGYSCFDNQCKYTELCFADSDCPTGYTCINEACKTAVLDNLCIVDADCLSSQFCENQRCRSADRGNLCRTNLDCPTGYKCSYLDCTKKESCNFSIECPSGYKCGTYSHRCESIGPCLLDNDCPNSFRCFENRCKISF